MGRFDTAIVIPAFNECKTIVAVIAMLRKYGDVIIFSTLLLHRSVKTKFPRLALSLLIKNFKYKNSSFEENRNWKIFSFSELTKIERYLGNHHLSPFRLLDIDDETNSGTL